MSLSFLLVVVAAVVDEPNWPQWRGPHRNGVASATGLPLEWSAGENVLWKTAIEGRGHSSPVVWGDRLFLTTDIEGEKIEGALPPEHIRDGEVYLHPDSQSGDRRHTLKVLALDAATGAIVWSRTAHDGRVYDNRHRVNTYASPTAVADGERVYVYFGSEGLLAYDFEGALLWQKDLGRSPELGPRPGDVAASLPGTPHPASRSQPGRRVVHRRVRSRDGPGSLDDAEERAHQLQQPAPRRNERRSRGRDHELRRCRLLRP